MKRLITLATVLLVGLASVAGRADRRSAEKEEEKSANHPGGNARAKERRDANKQAARQHADD